MSTFLLELGTEELPARFLPLVREELERKFASLLATHELAHDAVTVRSTPRRAVVRVGNLPATSPLREELVMGPPKRIAYDVDGKPTKAGEGFARTQGVDPADLFIESTDKGEYLAARKKVGGMAVAAILAEASPEIIASLSFPKRMHWGCGTFTFARPLRWILALLDEAVVAFSVAGVDAGRETRGHRVHGPGPFAVPHAEDYDAIMETMGKVTVDGEKRRAVIRDGADKLAAAAHGRVLWKDSLLDEVEGLTEHPVPMLGNFAPEYLEIPRQVLLTSMEVNQKSFGLENEAGDLLPHFITVLNMTPPDPQLVRSGWERVLRARLEDARFFWQTDLAVPLESWLDSLDSVIFLAPLGSMGDKTRRLEQLCAWLAEQCGGVETALAARAGRISKADLVSGMVGEFDTLQGIMGGIYARRKGEDAAVAEALAEQYLPAGPDSPTPSSRGGAFLSMADKADTLAGCFGLGMAPTGTVDPYALRRCALGIARIILDHGLDLDVRALFAKAQELYGERKWKVAPDKALDDLVTFFTLRLKNLFTGQGNSTLLVEAVLDASISDVRRTRDRLQALVAFSGTEAFAPAAMTFKRVVNIVRKQEGEGGAIAAAYDASTMKEDAEKALAARLDQLLPEFESLWQTGDYARLLSLLAELRPDVDAFFEAVMVMAEDPAERANRLGMLKAIAASFGRLADFTALQM